MSAALIDYVGTDLIDSKRIDIPILYAVSVKGRNFPNIESKSFQFNQNNINKLTETATTFGLVHAVLFVFVHEMESKWKIHMLVARLSDLLELSTDDSANYINKVSGCLTIKYTGGQSKHWLSEIMTGDTIAYFKLQFN